MGTLTPGGQYIYERANGITYAREFGKTDRTIVGYDYNDKTLLELKQYHETQLWKDILKEAATNKTLQDALDRVKVLYYLSKENEEV